MPMFDGPPDSYWEPPEPSPSEVLEEAEYIADNLVAEWATMGEFEVWIGVSLNRSNEPTWTVSRVATDGDVLFGGPSGESEEFEHEDDLRRWLLEHYPFPAEQE